MSEKVFNFLWTESHRQTFIQQHLGLDKLELYKHLVPGAYRADLFKYVVMYYIGGIYSDVDAFLKLNLSIQDGVFSTGATMAIDSNPRKLLPGALLISPPANPLFICAIGEVLDHSSNRYYPGEDPSSSLDVSGPGVLGECVRHLLGQDVLSFVPGELRLGSLIVRLLSSHVMEGGQGHTVETANGSEVIRLMPGGAQYPRQVSPDCDPGEHYSVLFSRKQIYAEGA